jgi:hypothetical protein
VGVGVGVGVVVGVGVGVGVGVDRFRGVGVEVKVDSGADEGVGLFEIIGVVALSAHPAKLREMIKISISENHNVFWGNLNTVAPPVDPFFINGQIGKVDISHSN